MGLDYRHVKPVNASIGGRFFRFKSTWEYNYALFLQHLCSLGVVTSWDYEGVFLHYNVSKHYKIKGYLSDFTFKQKGSDRLYFVEIKGRMDNRSRHILNGLKKHHPTIEVKVIRAQAYYKVIKQFYGKIPFRLNDWDLKNIK